MADKVITSTGDCSACCDPAPADCSCALLIPPPIGATPYADYATAETAIADTVFDCLLHADGDLDSASASFDGTTYAVTTTCASGSGSTLGVTGYSSVSLKSGATLSAAYTITSDGTPFGLAPFTLQLLGCSDGVAVDGAIDSATSGTLTVTAPADGEYIIVVIATVDTATTLDTTWDFTSSDTFWVNPVIALWDDSGTTRSLWACPKLLLPPLTEDSGTWYADCAAADAVLTDAGAVSNCIGYNEGPLIGGTFSATGGSSLVFSVTSGGPPFLAVGPFWGSVNIEAGETITVSCTGFTDGTAVIYDDTGTEVETLGPGAMPLTSSALPAGKYTVRIELGDASAPTTATATITSSGTMSVNEIQARYDLGLVCPATLDCGDACP